MVVRKWGLGISRGKLSGCSYAWAGIGTLYEGRDNENEYSKSLHTYNIAHRWMRMNEIHLGMPTCKIAFVLVLKMSTNFGLNPRPEF